VRRRRYRQLYTEAVLTLAGMLDVDAGLLDDSAFRRKMKRRQRYYNRRNTSTSARFRAGTRALKR
jgi:hypothetical protein